MLIQPMQCHASTPCPAISAFDIEWEVTQPGLLSLRYRVQGEVAHLRIPEAKRPTRTDGLWRHTCCEAFIRERGQLAYYEFNLSPSGDWAVYRFADYRSGMEAVANAQPPIATYFDASTFELRTELDLHTLGARFEAAPIELGLSAVIEDQQGQTSYWAIRHAPGEPDFHHTNSFARLLEPAGTASTSRI